ncbi:MAG: carboxypeptidase M32 [Clostridium butyricum]|nr:carboxypeptidase M32 [Clostridium butyricum]
MLKEINLNMEKLQEVKEYIKNIDKLEYAYNLVSYDNMIFMPKKALEQRSEVLGYLSTEIFKLRTSYKVKEFITYFNPLMEKLSDIDRAMIKNMKKNYEQVKNIPREEYKEFMMLAPISEAAWEEAKEKNDFYIYEPYLQKMVEFSRNFAEYYGYEDNKYDALLNIYEPGMTVKKLDKIFSELRDGIIEILKYIENSNKKINRDFLKDKFSIEKQRELSKELLRLIKFDMEAGRLDESMHPFTTNFWNNDVRLTTHYYEEDLMSNIFSVIHEGGHGLYEQHIDNKLVGTGLGTGVSMGIHESQSRFYENIIGRSKEFLSAILPLVKNKFPQLEEVTLDEFYEAVNYVKPSLIRTEADELTYSLHIIIRYEIEKQLINGEIEVKDLPRVWNEKYVEYLGVEPTNDSEGVLQDVHWSDGSFGYFPSYALGNIYGGQLLNSLLKENKDAIKNLKNGDISFIDSWLKENIHRYGCMYEPEELIKNTTKEEISTKYYLKYLEKKYKEIY